MFILVFLLIYGLLHPLLISSSTRESLILFTTYILPSLFFYMIILDILLKSKWLNKATNRLFFIFKIFKIRYSTSILLLISSILVGNPTNAKNIIEMYDNKRIDYNEANYLLATTHSLSIGFIFSFLTIVLNKFYPSIFISIIISNLFLMLINQNKGEIKIEESFVKSNGSSINKTINILVMICAITLFSGIVIDILLQFNYPTNLIGFIEITRGIKELNNLDLDILIPLISSLISFGGISINLQIYNIVNNKLNYKRYIINRIIASILTFIICFIIQKRMI